MAKTVTISVTLTQAGLKLAEKLAKEHELPLAQCVKQFRLCDQVFEEHFETLKRRAAAQPEGQPFTVMGLFDDAEWNDLDQIADWAVESMANLVNNGLMAGKSGGLAPTANTTVEEAIVLVLAQYNKF